MVEIHRNLWCAFYPACLNQYARNGRYRFTCKGCRQYRPLYVDPQTLIEDAIRCGEFLHELFFGVDPYEEKKGMKKQFSDDDMVPVPARVLRGLIVSFTQGMHYFAGSGNLIKTLDDILKQGNSGKPEQSNEPLPMKQTKGE